MAKRLSHEEIKDDQCIPEGVKASENPAVFACLRCSKRFWIGAKSTRAVEFVEGVVGRFGGQDAGPVGPHALATVSASEGGTLGHVSQSLSVVGLIQKINPGWMGMGGSDGDEAQEHGQVEGGVA